MFRKTLLLSSALALVVGLTSFAVHAEDIDVDASLTTQQAISLTKNADMAFGDVEFDATHAGQIRLATNGTVTVAAATGIVMSGTPAAGSVGVSGDGDSTIEISCETGGILSDGTNSLTLQATEVSTAAGGVAFSAGSPCTALGTSSTTVDLGVTPNPIILIGGEIDVDGNAIASSATYDTTQAGGDPVTLQVVYQ